MHSSDFRRMALAMPGAVEGAHMGHPDFRVDNRIFATLHDDRSFGMVTLTPEQQAQFIGNYPDVFAPESGAWGRAGSTRVRLASANDEVVGEAMTLAWQNTVNKTRSSSRRPRTRSAQPSRRSRIR
jgi:hypothetical protein